MSFSVESIVNLLEAHPHLLLFPLVLVEGPISTIAAGLLAAAGVMVLPIAYAVAVTADLTGNTFYYLLGRSARYPKTGKLLVRLGLSQEKLTKMEVSFGRNYGKALVGAKIADFTTIPVFLAAGLSKVGYGRFLAWTGAATVLKSGSPEAPQRRPVCSAAAAHTAQTVLGTTLRSEESVGVRR